MNVSGIDSMLSTLAQPAESVLWSDPSDGFSLRIDSLQRARDQKERETDVRQMAEQFVATSLIGPLMVQVRDDPFKSDLFHGGFTEDAFMRQFDEIIADRMSKRMSMPIVDAIYKQFAGPTGTQQPEVDVHG